MGVLIESRDLKDRQPRTMSLTTARVQCKADDIRNKQFITYSVIITQASERVASSVRISTNVASLPRTKD